MERMLFQITAYTVNDVPGKDPLERPLGKTLKGFTGVFPSYLSPGKTPQTPVNPPRGSFQGIFPWDIIDGS